MEAGGAASAAEQEKLLQSAVHSVSSEAFQMKRCLDGGRLMEALKHASQMLSELRTGALSPKYYYRLYIDITTELQHLELYLVDEFHKGHKVADLYELVQYAGNIIPRLYLMITVGTVYMKCGEGDARVMLNDLVEMCRGVQHPLRGLFIRNYLLQCTRNLLPDAVQEGGQLAAQTSGGLAGPAGTLHSSISFILLNFAEMNKLWVRMQYAGSSKLAERREKERQELRILVGTNLVRLSQLDNVDLPVYRQTVLPAMLEQVVSCRDALAQEYLMECIIQVFPDDFHLSTLDELLAACAELHQAVQMRTVLIALIDRIAVYCAESERRPEGAQQPNEHLFEVFSEHTNKIVASRHDMPLEDVVALQTALVRLALRCYPDRKDYVDTVLAIVESAFAKHQAQLAHNGRVGRELLKLIRLPVEHYGSVVDLLDLPHFKAAYAPLDYRGRTLACLAVCQRALETAACIDQVSQAEGIVELLEPLVSDQSDQPADVFDSDEFGEEQHHVARLIALLHNETSADTQYLILAAVRKKLGTGGSNRMRFTLPPLVFAAYKLARRFNAHETKDEVWSKKLSKVFKFAHDTVAALCKEADMAALPLRLYLAGALALDQCDQQFAPRESIAYDFVSQAFSIYEDEISDSRSQLAAVCVITAALQQMRCFGADSHEPLRTQCALAAARLFKKPDQCRGLFGVAHLFWSATVAGQEGQLRDGKRVADCMKKALKVAGQCSMDPALQLQLFIEALDHYLYFYEAACGDVTPVTLNQLLGKIRETLPQLEDTAEHEQLRAHFQNTLVYVRQRAEAAPAPDAVPFDGIIL